MKQSYLLLLLTVLLIAACGNDDSINPISFIGNDNGWVIESVTSDYQVQADAAIAALTEEALMMAGRTRAEVQAQFDASIATQTNVEDCDRDDLLFFVDNGEMRVIKGNVICAEPGDPTVLAIFNQNNYSTNADATRMTIRRSDGSTVGVYDITELTADIMQLDQRRTVTDTLVGPVEYDFQFRLKSL